MPLRKKRKGSGDDEGVDDEEFEVDSEEESSSSDEGSESDDEMEEEEEGGGGEEGEEEECVAEGTADTPTVPVTPAPVKKRRPYDMTKRRQKAAERAAALGLPPPPAAPPKAASHSTDAGPSAATAAATSGVKRRRESEVKSRRDSDAGTRRHDGEDAEYDLAAARKSMLLSRGGEHNGIARVARPKNVFARELPALMYGFGDSVTPYKESMELIEEALVDFVTEVTTKAVEIGEGRPKMRVEDLLFILRNDRKKFARAKELLVMSDEIQRARKAFDTDEYSKDK